MMYQLDNINILMILLNPSELDTPVESTVHSPTSNRPTLSKVLASTTTIPLPSQTATVLPPKLLLQPPPLPSSLEGRSFQDLRLLMPFLIATAGLSLTIPEIMLTLGLNTKSAMNLLTLMMSLLANTNILMTPWSLLELDMPLESMVPTLMIT